MEPNALEPFFSRCFWWRAGHLFHNAKQLLGKWGLMAVGAIFAVFVTMLVSKVAKTAGGQHGCDLGIMATRVDLPTGGYIFRYLTGRLHVEDGDMEAKAHLEARGQGR